MPGVLVEPDEPYLIQPRRARPHFDPTTVEARPMRQVSRHVTLIPPAPITPDLTIAPRSDISAGAHESRLRQRQHLREWVGVMGLESGVWDTVLGDPSAMLGIGSELGGYTLEDLTMAEPRMPSAEALLSGQLTTERTYGRVYPLQFMRNAERDLLEAFGGWNKVGLLHTNWRIDGPCTFEVHVRDAGCVYRLYIGGQEVTEGQTVALDAGYYPVWVMLQTKRRAPVERKARFGLELRLVGEDTRPPREVHTPRPGASGFVQPRTSESIVRAQQGVAAYQALFASMGDALQPDLRHRVATVAEAHAGTAGGHAAAQVLRILDGAPYDESDPSSLNAAQWGELVHYYQRVGLWLRVWRINKGVDGVQRYIAAYPQHIQSASGQAQASGEH